MTEYERGYEDGVKAGLVKAMKAMGIPLPGDTVGERRWAAIHAPLDAAPPTQMTDIRENVVTFQPR